MNRSLGQATARLQLLQESELELMLPTIYHQYGCSPAEAHEVSAHANGPASACLLSAAPWLTRPHWPGMLKIHLGRCLTLMAEFSTRMLAGIAPMHLQDPQQALAALQEAAQRLQASIDFN